ncbi:hypothetical protein H6F86_19980 [Phormidium sp. FACHB-592]|uniref:Uncharacterized protein n=1 Tax=Stenomitos frigidus AS-A4 TaxID=2933935 RepID=A0ABV0KE42_9CYAN|nr:hypothetical protein [Phormidium sp. FACHB-592]MBD2076109.1 hypothetical protein [Phormidium sp. FACHB-592]
MDELHARVRSFRSSPTEINLAKQPYPEFDDSDTALRQGEANVVEMPNRQTHEAFVPLSSEPSQTQRSTAKRKQTAAKRKPAAANPKALSFRQMRDGHQQPYIDELKRLEAQAERINQLLADRKRKQARAGQPEALTNHDSLLEADKPSPKKKASKSAKQASRPAARSPQREVPPMPAPDDDTEALEAQAARIKELLQALETAIAEGETLPHDGSIAHHSSIEDPVEPANPEVKVSVPPSGVEPFNSSTYRHSADTLLTGSQKPTIIGATDHKAQQEAAETAQALRYLASRDTLEPAIAAPRQEPRRPTGRSHEPRSSASSSSANVLTIRRYALKLRQFLQMPHTSLDRVKDAALWIVLAAAIRVGARLLLMQVPALAPVLLVLMFAPAAAAVYLAMCVPKAGFVSIYRLFLIMLGLLLGGRF